MQKNKWIFLWIALGGGLVFSSGCKSKQAPGSDANSQVDPAVSEAAACSPLAKAQGKKRDPLTGWKVFIEGDCIVLDVLYSGGCQEHGFDLYFSGAVAKSMPPQASLYLFHDNKGDGCRSILKKTLRYSLEEFAPYAKKGVVLHVESGKLARQTLTYQSE